jgi:hypothetical protein
MGSRADLKRGWRTWAPPRERLGCCPHPVSSHTEREREGASLLESRAVKFVDLACLCVLLCSLFSFPLTWNAPQHSGRWIHFFPFDFANGSNSFLTKCRRNLTLPHPAPPLSPGRLPSFLVRVDPDLDPIIFPFFFLLVLFFIIVSSLDHIKIFKLIN